jgi:hypothetical protein
MSSPTDYRLLWVRRQKAAKEILTPEQLDKQLGTIHAGVAFEISAERENLDQTAIQIFSTAKEETILAKLTELKYEVVDKEIRRIHQRPRGHLLRRRSTHYESRP